MTDANTGGAFDDPDRALPTEDDDPETLAGDPVEFDPGADDQGTPVDEPAPPANSRQLPEDV
jgi:hypothetical protein